MFHFDLGRIASETVFFLLSEHHFFSLLRQHAWQLFSDARRQHSIVIVVIWLLEGLCDLGLVILFGIIFLLLEQLELILTFLLDLLELLQSLSLVLALVTQYFRPLDGSFEVPNFLQGFLAF